MNYGFPLPTSAKILNNNDIQFTASLNTTNTINAEEKDNELLFVDAETYQLNLLLEYGLNKNWMLRFQLPFVSHSAGFLDSWINDYHDLLSLPEHIRPQFPVDQIQVHYQRNSNSLVNLQTRTSGMGDISMQLGYQVQSQNDYHLSYWGSLKLPTGEAPELTGSGSTDLAFWLSADKGLSNQKWLYGTLGFMLMNEGDILPSIQKHSVVFANAGFQMHPWEMVLITLQLDSHSAVYNSDTKFLGPVVQFTFGGSLLFDSSTLDIGVSEDIMPQASPDVTFNISWKIRY